MQTTSSSQFIFILFLFYFFSEEKPLVSKLLCVHSRKWKNCMFTFTLLAMQSYSFTICIRNLAECIVYVMPKSMSDVFAYSVHAIVLHTLILLFIFEQQLFLFFFFRSL